MADIRKEVDRVREAFFSGLTRPLSWRVDQLRALRALVVDNQSRLCHALSEDLGKPKNVALLTEILPVVKEIDLFLSNLSSWAKPRKAASKPLANAADTAYVRPEPYGVVLILGAWNFPVNLALIPLVGAIGAGNAVVLKPSEQSATTAKLLEELAMRYLDTEAITVINGDAAVSAKLTVEVQWDYIFYTGGSAVGRKIMAAAAKHLTPVTLELGGKNPCIVDDTCNIEIAARRIVWARFLNAGQVCLCPDYVMVVSHVMEHFVRSVKKCIGELFPDTREIGKIVNERHFDRLNKVLEESAAHGDVMVVKGERIRGERFIAPTVVQLRDGSPLLEDELFGPILCLMPVETVSTALQIACARPKPLAAYLFTESKSTRSLVEDNLSSGALVVNDLIMHFSLACLPFGGVGESGMGAYHGHASFTTFSHDKSVLVVSTAMDPAIRYPPLTDGKLKALAALVYGLSPSGKRLPLREIGFALVALAALGAFFGAGMHEHLLR